MGTFLHPGLLLLCYLSVLHLRQEATEGDSFHSNLWLPFPLLNAWVRSGHTPGDLYSPLQDYSEALDQTQKSITLSFLFWCLEPHTEQRIWSNFLESSSYFCAFQGLIFVCLKLANKSFLTSLLEFFSAPNNQYSPVCNAFQNSTCMGWTMHTDCQALFTSLSPIILAINYLSMLL